MPEARNPDRAVALLEEAARLLGFGEFHGSMDVELGRGPRVIAVYRKDRIPGDQLAGLVDELHERAAQASRDPAG